MKTPSSFRCNILTVLLFPALTVVPGYVFATDGDFHVSDAKESSPEAVTFDPIFLSPGAAKKQT